MSNLRRLILPCNFMKVVIIDDEKSNVELTNNLLKLYCPHIEVTGTAGSVEEGYAVIVQQRPDLIFLDVQMQDGTGFDLLNRFSFIFFKIVFITAHQDFALAALKRSAVDYLLKPLSPPDITEAVNKATQQNGAHAETIRTLLDNLGDTRKQKQKLILKTMERIYSVPVKDIVRFQSEGSYTEVFLNDGKKIVVSRLIKEFDELLARDGFLRVHQSHLINPDYIFFFEKSESFLTMKDESTVPVSTRKKESLISLLNN